MFELSNFKRENRANKRNEIKEVFSKYCCCCCSKSCVKEESIKEESIKEAPIKEDTIKNQPKNQDPLKNLDTEIFYDALSYFPDEEKNSNKNSNKKIEYPINSVRIFKTSYIVKNISIKGPRIYIHISETDALEFYDSLKRKNNEKTNFVVNEILKATEEFGYKINQLDSMIKKMGYKSYNEFITLMMNSTFVNNYEEQKNKDGSLDIYQPILSLLKKTPQVLVGNKWIEIPKNTNVNM